MKIDIAEDDLLSLRRLIEEAHERISEYPVMQNSADSFKGVRDQLCESQKLLRKFYRKLTRALEESEGHDCHASLKMQLP